MKKNLLLAITACFTFMTASATTIPSSTYAHAQELQKSINVTDIEYFYLDDEVISTYGLRYTLLKQLGIGLTIENKTAFIFADAETYESMNINITAELQQYKDFKWYTISTFKNSEKNSDYCYLQEEQKITSGYDYRVVLTATVNNGKNTETVTKNGSGKFCK